MTDFLQMPSGLILPKSMAEKTIRKRPKGLDLFSGAGGMSLGFIQAGYQVVAAVEYDCMAAIIYCTNLCRYGEFTMHFITEDDERRMERVLSNSYRKQGIKIKDGEVSCDEKLVGNVMVAGSGWISHQPLSTPSVSHVFVGDIRKLSADRILSTLGMAKGELDCVMGGPPCQGFSTAGKKNVYDPRNSLVFEFARLICDISPKAMVMEEVPNILNMVTPDGYPVVDQLCKILEEGSFAGFQAFKDALKNSPNAVSAIKTRKHASGPASDDKSKGTQHDLFAEVSA